MKSFIRVSMFGAHHLQFSILERPDEDGVLLHSDVFMAVRGDDLRKNRTVKSSEKKQLIFKKKHFFKKVSFCSSYKLLAAHYRCICGQTTKQEPPNLQP